ncbi:ABC-type amino acid transport substrate-binding protein [Pelomonas saccharophila]|uniref:ABC-type amino acid transport substrate-binding protein n=1 Tax=Roseateles saccharophilus TaxID=304 RepID=A0ABU1YH47_ROSSA|nr:transporter substrate-binding domain-containing protein [Roseateles saccharophilus]MDR7268172.1 ABC-type amino acid transport substrate-binding protein [Roseateles saccharophilus]
MRGLLVLLLALLCGTARAQQLQLLVFPNPGLFDVAADGTVSGPGAELLAKLGRVSGVPLGIQALPIPRALATASATPGSCAVGLSRTPEREAAFHWAGPLASGALVVYARADETQALNGPLDLRGHGVVVQRESAAANWLREQGIAAQEVNNSVTALRMLQARRVDFWFVNEIAAERVIRAEGGAPLKHQLTLGRVDAYVACHSATPREPVDRLHLAIQKLRRQGELAEFGLR